MAAANDAEQSKPITNEAGPSVLGRAAENTHVYISP
jgi:hypothetical protein